MSKHTLPSGTELPILNLRGKDYLEVKYRIVWFTEKYPNWSIETEFVRVNPDSALAKATIRDDKGTIKATSHKFEDSKGFPDFLEKAETGSIGRALALIGCGTQFCADELDEGKRIVDSPVSKPNPHAAGAQQPGPNDGVPLERGYYINFGKYNKRSLEQVARDDGPQAIESYMMYLENNSKKTNEPLTQNAATFIKEAEAFLKAYYANQEIDFNSATG
ncbi:MAG: hypothetical protein NVS3B3_21560 [Aquirhabdus sp.]